MKKKILISSVILVIILVAGVGFWKWKGVKNAEVLRDGQVKQVVQNEKQTQQQDDNQAQVDIASWKTYKNDEYGFEMNLPGNINKWHIEKKVFSKKDNIHNSETVTLYFNYDLDQSIARAENDPSLGKINDMSLWYINIIPIRTWRPDACSTTKVEGPCRQGVVLGKNNKYVFESGYPNVEGTGSLCEKYADTQKEICSVDSNFYVQTNEIGQWKFKTINK
jgi:hypothetical protein